MANSNEENPFEMDMVTNRIVTENCQYGFPGNKRLLDFIQNELITDYVQLLSSGIFGSNATGIVAGCEIVLGSNRANPGIVLINGRLLPFAGGIIQSSIAIQDTTEQATFHDNQTHDAYKKATAIFAATGTTTWAALNTKLSIQVALQEIRNELQLLRFGLLQEVWHELHLLRVGLENHSHSGGGVQIPQN
jgi:hypothetical protein